MTNDIFSLASVEYVAEHLTASDENLKLISDFSASNNAFGLENYLKNFALDDEKKDFARTYLVKDKARCELVGYFSLRAGLVTIQKSSTEAFDAFPAVELSNFAVNVAYKDRHPNSIRHGLYIFRNFILPIVKKAKEHIGANTLYIYALPNDRLIEHYGTMGFERLSAEMENFVHLHIKPKYDDGCIFMSQTV